MYSIENDIAQTNPGAGNTPFGEFKNDVVPGDNQGTPLIEKWPNDLYYGFYAVLAKAGITPSGNAENTASSDFYNALVKLMEQFQSANFLNPTPQLVPNNTVRLSKGVTRDPNNPIAEPVLIAAGAADALPSPGVTADSRFDRLVHDKAGLVTLKLGIQDAFPVPPALVEGESPICRMLITTVGSPVFDNVQDIIFDERPINELPKLDVPTTPGKVVLAGRVNGNGTINKVTDFGSGASFTVSHPGDGVYDISFTGLGGFSNVHVISSKNSNFQGQQFSFLDGVTDKTLNTASFGTPTGFRTGIIEGYHDSCGLCPFLEQRGFDDAWSFVVIGLD